MSLRGISSHQRSGETFDSEFQNLAEELSAYLANEGVVRGAVVPGLPYFSQLSVEKKQEIIERIRFYLELCVAQAAEGYRLKDTTTFTWRALKCLGLVPPSDLFSHVTDEDVIEVYDSEGRQLYRNFRFFENCSYTLEELYCIEWWNLFDRDTKITEQLLGLVGKVLNSEFTGVTDSNCQPHLVTEKCSAERLEISYEKALISPLFHDKKVDAIMAIVRGRIVGTATP